VTCDKPNEYIYDFMGTSTILPGKEIRLTNKNVLLRGMTLSYGSKVLGCVVYTGHESKIVKNEGKPVYKTSRIMDRANRNMMFIVLL
jgi:magnesium-transporting ATPase (P-type)